MELEKHLHLFGPSRSILGSKFALTPDNVVGHVAIGRGDLLFIDYVLAENPEIKNVVELGTWAGMTALYMGMAMKLREGTLHTFDISDNRLECVKRSWLINMAFHRESVIDQVNANVEYVASKANTLLFVDNGNKPIEAQMYVRFLRTGSLILVHDWGTEIGPMVMEPLEKAYKLEQVYEQDAKSLYCSTRCWRKMQ